MKILLASSSSGSRGGGELYLVYLGRALVDRGHEVILWCSSHERMDELAETFGKFGRVLRSDYRNTYDLPGRSIAAFLARKVPEKVAREWRDSGADFVHLNKQNLEDGLDLVRALRLCGLPGLSTIHLTQSAQYLKAVAAAARDFVSRRALLAYPGLLVTVLENRRRDLADFLGDSPRIRMIANGVPLYDLSRRADARREKRAELGIADDALLICAVGRLVPQKRPLVFLECAERVAPTLPNAQFVWVGDGGLGQEWDREVAARNLGEKVRRVAWQADVPAFLLAADVFLHVAEYEGLPLAILEALSAGLPCAITENLLGEMPFLNAENSISVGRDDTWVATLRDSDKLRSIGAAGRALAEAEFSFGEMAARYEALYRESAGAAA